MSRILNRYCIGVTHLSWSSLTQQLPIYCRLVSSTDLRPKWFSLAQQLPIYSSCHYTHYTVVANIQCLPIYSSFHNTVLANIQWLPIYSSYQYKVFANILYSGCQTDLRLNWSTLTLQLPIY